MVPVFGRRFLETTRGQVVALLRAGPQTVDELAAALGLTDNAIRAHVATLERDGIVAQRGVRRGEGAGKPAAVYQLTAEAEAKFSRAYAPVLGAILEELATALPEDRRRALLANVGRRLSVGLMPPADASHDSRLQAALDVLGELGGVARLEERTGTSVIRGQGCPLSTTVAHRPEACHVVEALLREIVGAPVRQCCEHGERPSCCFEVLPAA